MLYLLFSFFVCIASCDPYSSDYVGNEKIKVLFVGNSLTYSNDLREHFKRIAKRNGKDIDVTMLAKPDYALIDHLDEGNIQKMLEKYRYTYVILQQGPSSQAEGRKMLLESAQAIQKICNNTGTKMAFFMVWPAYQHYANFDGVIKNYSDAALSVQAILCPVGKAWKDHMDQTGDLSYYGPDLFHPSVKGTEVAAQVIYKALFG